MTDNAPEQPIPVEQAFRFCPGCGAANQQVGKIPFYCGECGFAHYFGPVAAVGAMVVNEKNELLLVRRARNPGKGKWGLPGGFVDRNETIEDALKREVMEETKLVVTSMRLMMTKPNHYDYKGVVSPVIDLFYQCDVESINVIELALDELNHHIWVRPTSEHLENMAFVSNRIAIEHWLTLG